MPTGRTAGKKVETSCCSLFLQQEVFWCPFYRKQFIYAVDISQASALPNPADHYGTFIYTKVVDLVIKNETSDRFPSCDLVLHHQQQTGIRVQNCSSHPLGQNPVVLLRFVGLEHFQLLLRRQGLVGVGIILLDCNFFHAFGQGAGSGSLHQLLWYSASVSPFHTRWMPLLTFGSIRAL